MKKTLLSLFCLTLAACGSIPKAGGDGAPSLIVTTTDGSVRSISLATLSQRLPEKTLIVAANPAYGGATKKYQGFDLLQFLKMVDPKLDTGARFWVEVTTLDGWKAPAYGSDFLRSGHALLAVKELKETLTPPVSEDGLWSIVVTSKKSLYPGPFYIVWNDPGKNPDIMPLQVATLKISSSKPE